MKIYFAGSIRGGRDDKALYEEIIALLKKYGDVLTEHVGDKTLSVMGEYESKSKFIHDRDIEWLKEADIIIAEVTTASLGVGYEIAYAGNLGKEIHCLYRESEEKSLSAMIDGSSYCKVHKYTNPDEVLNVINNIFENK
jgi:nucleoside 2-deoxyribosyltransferase